MRKKELIVKIDDLLKPLNFTRKKMTWNRRSEELIEVVDLQISKSGDAVTVNAGVLDRDVYFRLWGSEPPQFIEEPECTVRQRVGYLIADKELWWQLHNDNAGEEIAKAITDHVLPFTKRMQSRQQMLQWLIDMQVVKKRYPLPIINLAILQYFLGKTSEACSLLSELEKKKIGAWCARAAEVAVRLECVN